MPPIVFSIAALCISALALSIATLNYRRKAGVLVRGAFSIASSRDSNDDYVSRLILENLKDRAITIFAVYLRVGPNYYIELEDLEESPLVLKAFETHSATYGPIEFYGINTNRIGLNKLLKDRNIKKRIVLSTSDGKYVVPARFPKWLPVVEYFRNYMTAIVKPVHSKYKGKYLGGNIKYVIEIIGEADAVEIIPVHPQDYEVKIFRNFRLTRETLESKETLEQLLQQQLDEGTLSCKRFVVYELDAWRARAHEFYSGLRVEAESCGFFRYHVVGRLLTKYHDWSLKKENAKRLTGHSR